MLKKCRKESSQHELGSGRKEPTVSWQKVFTTKYLLTESQPRAVECKAKAILIRIASNRNKNQGRRNEGKTLFLRLLLGRMRGGKKDNWMSLKKEQTDFLSHIREREEEEKV